MAPLFQEGGSSGGGGQEIGAVTMEAGVRV